MNKKLLLVLIISVMAKAWVAAQVTDTVPDLIISEQRMDWGNTAYIELTNMGDSTLDLSQFMITSPHTSNRIFYFAANTLLAKVESYVLCNKWEEEDNNWGQLQSIVNQFVFPEESSWVTETGGHDSISVGEYILQTWNGKYSSQLWYKSSDIDSMVIDCFNWNRGEDGTDAGIKSQLPVAGVVDPISNNTLIRKLSVSEGNMGDWDASRGVDASDSEWLLASLPTYNQAIPFSSVGNHGEDYPIVATSANSDVVVDLDNGTLTVPWGIYRGDSIISELNLGKGMAWTLFENAVFEDSVHNILQTGDVLQLKSFGNTMQMKDLAITVSPPASDMNKAFPVRNTGLYDADDPTSITVIKGTRYYVTDNMPTIDTIGNVPFACRVDTMLNYIEWASNANADFIWKDGPVRVDLMNGDILEVTAENGSKKQYYIDVQDYTMSDNVDLTAITWPDITMEHMLFDLNWITDTLPGFSPNKTNYEVTLKYGTTNVPAFKAYSDDLNAKISYSPAISLSGGFDERTTVITVTSESDTLTAVYKVTFNLEQREEDFQEFSPGPFISEFHQRSYTQLEGLEICNPGNVDLDLSNYLITSIESNDAAASVTQSLSHEYRYKMYVPGYRLQDDSLLYMTTDYKKLVTFDGDVNPIVKPGGVFTIGGGNTERWVEKNKPSPDWNIIFDHDRENAWGIIFPKGTGLTHRNGTWSYFLWEINDTENDSIKNGWKALNLNNLKLIDVLGYSDGSNFYDAAGYTGSGGGGISIIRKPHIWKGNDSYVISGGTTPEDSEWIVRPPADKGTALLTMGSQPLDQITGYLSTVSSLIYIVDPGYQGDLGITGIGNGETVQQFFDKLIQPDTGQDLSVKTNADGAILALTDPISQSDTLVVVSADGTNMSKYVLDVTPLNNNVNLALTGGSTLTIEASAVSGFEQGATLEDVSGGVKTESDLSIINIIDGAGALIPLKVLDGEGVYQPVLATSDLYIEVVAQNGDRKQYQLTPDANNSDAFVLSSVYEVDNDYFIISGLPGGTAVSAFMDNITPAEGATVKIIDKLDYDRTLGNLSYDDLLVVVSSDGSKTVTYMLNFVEEIIVNAQPSVSVASDNIEVEIGVATSVSVTADDDGLPAPPGALTYTWSVSSGEATNVAIANPDQATTDVTFSASGSYELQILVSDGELDATATVSVSVLVGVENLSSAFRMYPNPANEKVILEFMDLSAPVISIYNITGKAVYNGIAEGSTMTIDVSGMDTGLYFVKIENGGEQITKKLSIIK